jgi:hypothetical protein
MKRIEEFKGYRTEMTYDAASGKFVAQKAENPDFAAESRSENKKQPRSSISKIKKTAKSKIPSQMLAAE